MCGTCDYCGQRDMSWRAIATDESGAGYLVCGDCLELAAVMCDRCEHELIEAWGVVTYVDGEAEAEWNVCTPCRAHLNEDPYV